MAANTFYGSFDAATLGERRASGDDPRSPFQVDRDRIVFSAAFRQLQSKTQVFQSGAYDFYRTRLTHTIEVARVARSIAEYLNATSPHLRPDFFIDPDLVEAVGLAHDLGHPPFGHIGERKLHALMAPQGGFEGNAQSLRLLTELIYPRQEAPQGMLPTRALLDGVLKYKRLYRECPRTEDKPYPSNHFLYDDQEAVRDFVFGPEAPTLPPAELDRWKSIECQIMDWADDTAYSLHDIADGIRAGFITLDSLAQWEAAHLDRPEAERPVLAELQRKIRENAFEPLANRRIGDFIRACRLEPVDSPLAALTNRHRYRLVIDPEVEVSCNLHKRLAIDLIFRSPPLQQIEFRAGRLLGCLFEAYGEHYLGQPDRRLRLLPSPVHEWLLRADTPTSKARLLCDYMASLTDGQAIRAYRRLFDADFASIGDLP